MPARMYYTKRYKEFIEKYREVTDMIQMDKELCFKVRDRATELGIGINDFITNILRKEFGMPPVFPPTKKMIERRRKRPNKKPKVTIKI